MKYLNVAETAALRHSFFHIPTGRTIYGPINKGVKHSLMAKGLLEVNEAGQHTLTQAAFIAKKQIAPSI